MSHIRKLFLCYSQKSFSGEWHKKFVFETRLFFFPHLMKTLFSSAIVIMGDEVRFRKKAESLMWDIHVEVCTNRRRVCLVFERARSPRHFLLGSTEAFQGHQGNDIGRGCVGGNRLHCLREVSGLQWGQHQYIWDSWVADSISWILFSSQLFNLFCRLKYSA